MTTDPFSSQWLCEPIECVEFHPFPFGFSDLIDLPLQSVLSILPHLTGVESETQLFVQMPCGIRVHFGHTVILIVVSSELVN